MVDGRDVEPLVDESRCVAQDLAWRILTVWTETDGEVAAGLLDLVDGKRKGMRRALGIRAQYGALHSEWILPEPQRLFACGYPLETGLGLSQAQVLDGLASALPKDAGARWS